MFHQTDPYAEQKLGLANVCGLAAGDAVVCAVATMGMCFGSADPSPGLFHI